MRPWDWLSPARATRSSARDWPRRRRGRASDGAVPVVSLSASPGVAGEPEPDSVSGCAPGSEVYAPEDPESNAGPPEPNSELNDEVNGEVYGAPYAGEPIGALPGALPGALADALPADIHKEYRSGADELEPLLLDMIKPGDVVMIKSSKGIGFSKLVEALLKKFPAEAGHGTA